MKAEPINAWEAEWLVEHPDQGIEACRARAKQIIEETRGESYEDWELRMAEKTGWPPSLIKATADPFVYALGLKDGRVIQFHGAEVVQGGDWVHLDEPEVRQGSVPSDYNFERGIDIRFSEIVWVCDAPWGS